MADFKENVIEWITGDDSALVTFTQKRFINRIRKLSKTHGNCVVIQAENKDGSITARIPLSCIHLTIYKANMGGFMAGDDSD